MKQIGCRKETVSSYKRSGRKKAKAGKIKLKAANMAHSSALRNRFFFESSVQGRQSKLKQLSRETKITAARKAII
ncbi:MAG: hypothetical protein HFH48_03505 [Lachnospiraceae bacterium]|nr:hypothetical protein [Lachnospiraceae bacterium]